MTDCSTCPKGIRGAQRPCRNGAKQVRYTNTRRLSPNNCDYCYVKPDLPCASCPFESVYSTPPCPDTRCCCCTADSDYGFMQSIWNGFQRFFNGNGNRKRNCTPLCKGKVYKYSASQLKNMEKLLCKLEEDVNCVDETFKNALVYEQQVNCHELKCTLNSIADQLGAVMNDLRCACECYDPGRDKYEYKLISTLTEKASYLDREVYDLCLQLDCFELEAGPCNKPCCVKAAACKPNCKKPCCYRPISCPPHCKQCLLPYDMSFRKPHRTSPCEPNNKTYHSGAQCQPNLSRTSSVIPLGVMLVKL